MQTTLKIPKQAHSFVVPILTSAPFPQRNYIESLKIFDYLHTLIKNNGGAVFNQPGVMEGAAAAGSAVGFSPLQRSYKEVCKEIAIICNILAMAHLSTEDYKMS